MAKATAKAATKEAQLDVTKLSMSAKKIGANITVTVKGDGTPKSYPRRVSKEEGDKIIKEIEAFNKKPSQKRYDTIIKLATPEATKQKEAKEKTVAAAKGIKQQLKKEAKKSGGTKDEKSFLEALDEFLSSDEQAVDKLQALLDKHKKVKTPEAEPKARITTNPSSGEKYRNGVRVNAYYAYQDGKKVEVDAQGYFVGEW